MNEHCGRNALQLAGAVAMVLAAASASAETATSLGEVFVTAQKRDEALVDIPMSVSVLEGEALERQHVDNFQDLVALVPGLSINANTPGATRVTLRGINTGGASSTVGIYVDDVPFGSSSGLANGAVVAGDFDTFDMARIEVLRGPQGTLYGASSLGGVIKYVANEPSTAGFEGRAQGSMEDVEGGGTGYAVTGVVNVPMSETLAIRASGYYRSDEGFIDSIGNNPIPAIFTAAPVNIVEGSRVEDDLNDLETTGGRLSALYEPSESFSLNLTALFQDLKSGDANSLYEVDPASFEPLYGGTVVSRYHDAWMDSEYRVYSATVDWDLGPVTLQSVTGYGEFSQTFQQDIAVIPALGAPTAQILTFIYSTPGTADVPLSGILNQVTATDKFTQEFRLVSPESDALDWLIGAYYTDEDSVIDPQRVTAVLPGTDDPAPGIPTVADISILSTYEELALFANATWHIAPRFDLSFGGRWSENDQDVAQTVVVDLPPPFGGVDNRDGTSSESPFTWSISPRWEFSDATSMYARVATGFRPGGPNVLPPVVPEGAQAAYDSDELTSYELGLKTGNASGSFALDIAAYYLDWEDIQVIRRTASGFGYNANGGTAVSKGFEFTATTRSEGGFSGMLTGAYTDAYLTEDDAGIGGLEGDPLPYVPEWTLGLGGDYEWSAFGTATAYVGGQVSYTSDRPSDFGNRTAAGNIRVADAYTTLDLRAGILWDSWSLEFYGKNVTDEEGITDMASPGFAPNGAVGIATIRPRTIGMAVGVRF